MVKNIRFICCITLLVFSCIKDEGDLGIPFKKNIAVNFTAITSSINTQLECILSKNIAGVAYNNGIDNRITRAEVSFFMEKNDSLNLDTTGNKEYNLESPPLIPLTEYKIKINDPEFKIITATSICPDSVEILSLDISSELNLPYSMLLSSKIKFANLIQYGQVEIQHQITISNSHPNAFFKSQKVYSKSSDKKGELFSDIFSNEFNIDNEIINLTPYYVDTIKKYGIEYFKIEKIISSVHVQTIAEEHYNYIQDLLKSQNKLNDPFTEPIIVESNVSNGLGYFGIIYYNYKRFEN